jgi:hypothetical protein
MGSQNSKSGAGQLAHEARDSRIRLMLNAVFDLRLYGSSFFLRTSPLLALGLVVQISIFLLLARVMIVVYVPLFILVILVSGLGSKNYAREIPSIGYFRAFLLLIVSALASTVPFTLGLENTWYSLFRFLLTFGLSNIALTVAIVEVTIVGQRVSLRQSILLDDFFFRKEKKDWDEGLVGFPNSKAIVSSLNDGQFVASLFDKGSFNLAVLWSCNVMEKVIDSVVEGLVSQNPERKKLFRKDNDERRGYPQQLENLGPKLDAKIGSYDLTAENLWHKLRNDIAHYNYRPSFQETYGALTILVSFVEEMPKVLQAWK